MIIKNYVIGADLVVLLKYGALGVTLRSFKYEASGVRVNDGGHITLA